MGESFGCALSVFKFFFKLTTESQTSQNFQDPSLEFLFSPPASSFLSQNFFLVLSEHTLNWEFYPLYDLPNTLLKKNFFFLWRSWFLSLGRGGDWLPEHLVSVMNFSHCGAKPQHKLSQSSFSCVSDSFRWEWTSKCAHYTHLHAHPL